jgi:hypothetical protein
MVQGGIVTHITYSKSRLKGDNGRWMNYLPRVSEAGDVGPSADEVIEDAKHERRERDRMLGNPEELFEKRVDAQGYLFEHRFYEMGGIYRRDRHYASIHRLRSPVKTIVDRKEKWMRWHVSYWFEREHILPVRRESTNLSKARLSCWVEDF